MGSGTVVIGLAHEAVALIADALLEQGHRGMEVLTLRRMSYILEKSAPDCTIGVPAVVGLDELGEEE